MKLWTLLIHRCFGSESETLLFKDINEVSNKFKELAEEDLNDMKERGFTEEEINELIQEGQELVYEPSFYSNQTGNNLNDLSLIIESHEI